MGVHFREVGAAFAIASDAQTAVIASVAHLQRRCELPGTDRGNTAMMNVALFLFLVVGGQSTAFAQANVKEESVAPKSFGRVAYPPVARLGRIEGAVTLRIDVSEKGSVQEVTVISGPAVLVESSRENARHWTFPPGRTRTIVLTYVYEIDGFCDQSPPPSLMRIRAPYDLVKVTTCHEWSP
jgi:TonB family protein